MAPANSDWSSGRIVKCSYKRVTMAICAGNVVFAIYVLHALLSPLYGISPSPAVVVAQSQSEVKFTEEELSRMKAALRSRQKSQPMDLIKRVKEIEEEALREDMKRSRLQLTSRKLTQEILFRLKELKDDSDQDEHQALEDWKKKKLEEAKNHIALRDSGNLTRQPEDADMVAMILETSWVTLLEELGIPSTLKDSGTNAESNGKLLHKGPEIEDGIIPGRALRAECHAEPHTDYDGVAVRWGLTHHKESAADCCQACLDQAKNAKEGEKKCNIWVYCPSESGCFSPDIYEHKYRECWLKQADHPKTNFKGKYSESYRREHPTAPVVVPWVSGVTK